MEEKYGFLFTENEANTILGALGELPAKTSMAIIAKEILRTGQTSDLEDMWWYRKTEGIFRMIPR